MYTSEGSDHARRIHKLIEIQRPYMKICFVLNDYFEKLTRIDYDMPDYVVPFRYIKNGIYYIPYELDGEIYLWDYTNQVWDFEKKCNVMESLQQMKRFFRPASKLPI
jgi:hypothetical protein